MLWKQGQREDKPIPFQHMKTKSETIFYTLALFKLWPLKNMPLAIFQKQKSLKTDFLVENNKTSQWTVTPTL